MAVALVSMVLIGQAASWMAVDRTLNASAWREADERLRAGLLVLQQMLKVRANQLEQSALLLASDFGFKGAVATADEATIRSMLVNHSARIGSDQFWLLDLDGEVLLSLAPEVGTDRGSLRTLVSSAKADGATSLFTTIGNSPLQIVLVPVMAPRRVGWAVLGFSLDQTLVEQMSKLTGLEVSLLASSVEAAGGGSSSLDPTSFVALRRLSLPAMSAGVVRLQLADHEFLTLREELSGVDLLLHLERASVLEGLYRLRAELAVIVALVLAGSLLVALLMARNVTKPLQRLAYAAQRIGRGDYSKPVPMGRADEVGALALTLEQMRSGIAEREATIAYQAFHDPLTGLPNRAKAQQILEQALLSAKQADAPLALLMVGLDRFKEINDSLGHLTGDQVLLQIGKRLSHNYGQDGQVARLGGDEFLVLLPAANQAIAERAADRLINLLAEAIALEDMEVRLDASVGIARFPADGDDAATLLARADIAMNDAKAQHLRWHSYLPGRDDGQRDKLSLANDLRLALEREQLSLHYQPKLDLSSGLVTRAEALLRWTHPTRGFVGPDLFIPLAEQTGRICELTRWVLRSAIEQILQWAAQGHPIGVAVNLSVNDLMNDDLPEFVQGLLAEFALDPKLLTLEVTESAVMRDASFGMAMLHRLKALGVALAIDDYGTGYSSLSYLKQLPVDEIKIDKSFVMNLDRDIDDAVIVRSTIDLGHNMGLQVVAEGVEDGPSLDRLRAFQCDQAQGYWIGRPMPAAQMLAWLQQRTAARATSSV